MTISASKLQLTVGENVIITVKVGNNGPDTAEGVVLGFTVPDGFEFIDASVDSGTFSYDPPTRTVAWNIGDVPVGDPYMYVTLRTLFPGTSDVVARIIAEETYDPDDADKVITLAISVQQQISGEEVLKVSAQRVSMLPTGVPLVGLVLALVLLTVGFKLPKKKTKNLLGTNPPSFFNF